jgi:hypothetical protein
MLTSTESTEKKSIHELDTRQLRIRKANKSRRTLPVHVILGILLTLMTTILHAVAFFTPHWKEISPTALSLYVNGVDALIRTEVLHYFNSVHRSTRHSYGLFQHCEYSLGNRTNNEHHSHVDIINRHHQNTRCTRNVLPTYVDDDFNRCHSLAYYRFCTKSAEKTFDIDHNYRRSAIDSQSTTTTLVTTSTSSCQCRYPPYVTVCHIIGILTLILLGVLVVLFSCLAVVENLHYRLRFKCLGILVSFLVTLFMLINLLIILQHVQYESIDYLVAIERHYKFNQIYKLSQDVRTAIDRFLLTTKIRLGYSTFIGWTAFACSIINGIFFLSTCRSTSDEDDVKSDATRKVDVPSSLSDETQQQLISTFTSVNNDVECSSPPPPLPDLNDLVETRTLPFIPNNRTEYQTRVLPLGIEV